MSRFIAGLLTLTVCHIAIRPAFADAATKPETAGRTAVESALQAEVGGSLTERELKLHEALDADPKLKEARWLSGQLQHDGEWVYFKELVPQLGSPDVLNEYRALRDAAPNTARAQVDLANWCRSHKLREQERAHLIVALELSDDSENPAIRARLGQKLIDGVWMSDTEIRQQKEQQADERKKLKAWRLSIETSAKRLSHRSADVRESARHKLEELGDPATIPALEATLADAGIEEARLLVELLGNFKTYKAAQPLARLAVTSEWEVVRKEAALKLRERPVGAYAPQLLSSMRTPIESKVNLLVGLDGVHVTHELSTETEAARQRITRNRSTFVEVVGLGSGDSITGLERDVNRLQRAREQAAVEAKLDTESVERQVAEENESISDWNSRVCAALAEATAVSLPADPNKWWDWWRNYNQLSEVPKQDESDYIYEARTEYVESSPIVQTAPQISLAVAPTQTECLVAGTQIWTDRGLLAIEAAKVGDLVLSKHPETGELAYKPVLRTSVRQPEPVFKVATDHGEIRATGGHVFWVSGQGWTRMRDVRPGQRFHGATKPTVIRELKMDGRDRTYNLIVADFHTYFVGPEHVLSHDLTFARPVDVVVPGMEME